MTGSLLRRIWLALVVSLFALAAFATTLVATLFWLLLSNGRNTLADGLRPETSSKNG